LCRGQSRGFSGASLRIAAFAVSFLLIKQCPLGICETGNKGQAHHSRFIGKANALFGGVNSIDRSPQGTVLAIDDEPEILNLFRAALETKGFVVQTASSPVRGIHLFEQQWQNIQLVLMDFMMPEMTGDLVLERLQRINPNVRVMLVTGSYVRGENERFENGLAGYLQKPFDLEILAQRVRDVIDAAEVCPLSQQASG
jgi:CheY-like chemotaxis protein